MKMRPLYGAYLCNMIVAIMVYEGLGIWAAVVSILILSGSVTLCQMEWERLGPRKNDV
jgi:hypothetical protein